MRKFKLLLTGILLFSSFSMFAQQAIKGVVKEKTTGEGLPGVSVVVKGTTNGVYTDFDGNFQLNNVKTGDVLVFTFLGFKNQELTIATNFNLTVELEESSERLDEIVIVGYGSTTVKDATGSVEAITEKDFTKGNIVTPENLLSGRVSGVNVTTSGAPGAGSQITIRGGSSISASNNPLIIVDGLPLDQNGVSGSRGVLSTINPNDIESFSVLKDASATAIYGSRAANGVIIITTKKGKKEVTFDYDMQYNIGEVQDRIDVFSADEFRQIIAQQRPADVGLLGSADTDWQDAILRSTLSSNHNFSVRGSILEKIPTRISVGFTKQEGAIKTSKFERSNVSLSMNPSFFDNHLKVSLNYNRAFEDNRFANGGIGAALRFDPTQPIYDAASPFGGFFQYYTVQPGGDVVVANATQNPLASIELANSTGRSARQYGNLNFDYKFHFLPELKAVVNFGYDQSEGSTLFLSGFQIGNPDQALQFAGTEATGFSKVTNELLDGYLNYKNDFNKLGVDFTAGYSYQKFTNNGGNSGNLRDTDSFSTTFANPDVVNIGFFGRANITYDGKYLLTLNYRRDGTSRFSSENRWGNFGGAAVAWRMSDEDFLKDSKVISELKLRASYGQTGQQNLPGVNDIYLNRYRFGNQNSQFLFGGNLIASTIPSVVNPDLKWEETTTLEFGIDYGLFDNKVSGSINYFQKTSEDLLFNAALPDGVNFGNSVIQNIGELQVDGVELNLNATVVDTEDFNWNFTFNATYIDREIAKLSNGQDVRTGGTAGGTGNTIQLLREGESPFAFHVYKQLYDASGAPIEGAYADLDGNGIINDDDRYLKENPQADVTLGYQSNFEYKGFDLAFNLRASIGNYVYNNVNSSRSQLSLLQDNAVLGNVPSSVLNTNFVNTSDVLNSDIYIENASFLRMDNITIGYTFNQPIKKFGSRNTIRLWMGVQNVFIITNYSGLDPEVFGGIDNTIFPRSRNILFGANIKF
ncbi:MAG: SusC/RagA family TonB-linked outer membrane protein [Flavobacteriaceae bacterium]